MTKTYGNEKMLGEKGMREEVVKKQDGRKSRSLK
jgi:hypothetical protein